jgi:hypothetical protein
VQHNATPKCCSNSDAERFALTAVVNVALPNTLVQPHESDPKQHAVGDSDPCFYAFSDPITVSHSLYVANRIFDPHPGSKSNAISERNCQRHVKPGIESLSGRDVQSSSQS